MNNTNALKFDTELIKRLNAATATANGALAEAALAAVAQDKKISVRAFASAIRDAAPCLTAPNAVFTAAVKAAKEKGATANAVAEAMACALAKKRADDRKRAADKAAAKPGKALERAEAKVEECLLAMRSPLEKAVAEYTAAEQAVADAEQALTAARRRLADAKAVLELAEQASTEQASTEQASTEQAPA